MQVLAALFAHATTTGAITVRVRAQYAPEQSRTGADRWFWTYHIRVENDGDTPVQLLTRRWRICDARGAVHIVEGDGVVGEQPVIMAGGAFDYVSGCPLSTASGHMSGHFGMIGADGSHFIARIPGFSLAVDDDAA